MRTLIVLLLVTVLGCDSGTGGRDHPQRSEIERALLEMLRQSADPFLIVEDSRSDRFIQFYNDSGAILVDLPLDALAADEKERASRYFERVGIALSESRDTDPSSGQTFVTRTYSKTFPAAEVSEVLELTLGALYEIYGMSERTELALTRGWR